MMATNRRIVLASRPKTTASLSNFRLEEVQLPTLQPGEFLVRNHWLSLDPYMRGRMNDAKSYTAPQPLDQVMLGATAGEVIESRNRDFAAGSKVVAYLGWQEHGVSDGAGVMKVDTRHVSLQAYLGVVGMPGVTAWYGLNRIIEPREGLTIVVSAASGAVGSVVGQLARIGGARAIGIAGGTEKCRYVVEELRFDACIDYKSDNSPEKLSKRLKEAAPNGVDGYFENVGGAMMNAVLPRMNAHGRIALCGLIAGYDAQPIPIDNPTWFLINRLTLQGFIITEHMDVWPAALKELGEHVAAGRIKYRESVAHGIENAPQAFLGMLKGANFGKQLVKLVR
ncbi:MAG: NADP-dependent oxidoreductase [Burkholderiaceae bacterium]